MKGILPATCLAAFLGLASVPSIAAGEGAVEGGPELRLSVHGEFRQTEARVGDTVVYRVRVEWQDVPAAVMLLPLPQLETPGFVSVGGSTEHRKKLSGGKSMNVTEYAYALVAREPGVARVAPFSLNYRNGLTGRDESVGVPGASIEISAAPVPWARRPATWVLAALVLLTGAGWAVRTVARARKERRATGAMTSSSPKESPLDAEIALLRARCESADARAWTADAEKLCTRFLCDRLGVTRTENVRFEAALDQYLQRGRDTSPEVIAGWNALRELFHEARYAGARREPHALLEACRHLKTCLNPSEGIEHGQPVSA